MFRRLKKRIITARIKVRNIMRPIQAVMAVLLAVYMLTALFVCGWYGLFDAWRFLLEKHEWSIGLVNGFAMAVMTYAGFAIVIPSMLLFRFWEEWSN